jgi:hypothetical protein
MKLLCLLFLIISFSVSAQSEQRTSVTQVQKMINDSLASKWYEKIQLRGYAHFRYNRLFESNNQLRCSSCDKSIGDKQGFFLRRARLILFGEVSDRVFIYIQPDYATDAQASSGTQNNYLQIRDAYFDYALTEDKEYRVRTGISKVPFGFENLQSSSNRAPLDRTDPINSADPNERDTGVFFMYSPTAMRQTFKELTQNSLKGTGDYGMIATGVYNGQSLNRPEVNNDLHRVLRLSYPVKLKSGQFIEGSLHAYEGKFGIVSSGVTKNYYDQRSGASFIVYPQPLGIQIEYNVGSGPEYDPKQNKVRVQNLEGGYAQVNYQVFSGKHRFFPYVRYQTYKGGKKLEGGAFSEVYEYEVGSEWQPNNAFEMTVAFANSDRITQSSLTNRDHQEGHLVRLQAQFNY